MRSRKAKRGAVPQAVLRPCRVFLHPPSHCNCFPFVLSICTELHLRRHLAGTREQKTKLRQAQGSQACEPTVGDNSEWQGLWAG